MKNIQHVGLSLFFLTCGTLVFIVFSHYFPFFKGTTDILGRAILAIGLLITALFARRRECFQQFWLIPFASFTALAAISIDYYLDISQWILPALHVNPHSPAGLSIDKLESSLLSVIVILTINRLAGQSLESLYIRRGNLGLGLTIGLVAFVVMIAGLIHVTEMFFKGEDLTWARILPWAPWVLVMALSNAFNEELLFRGLLIGKMEPFIGKFVTNTVTTIPFVFAHSFTGYATDQTIFIALQLFPLSLLWCWLMQKTNSLWGSALFHAAMDIPVFVGIFSGR